MAERLSNHVRNKFINYFTTKHGHQFIQSSKVTTGQSSLSFVNAGMFQFRDLFLQDLQQYSPKRVCNYQKCIRVGGKMCDRHNIGYNLRHHSFFEMLGNWSFNDYGKPQACEWALDFLVNYLHLDANKMFLTYYADKNQEDTETAEIWKSLGFKSEQIKANADGDNFWVMGESGPCGMSTEIFYPVAGDSSRSGDLLEIWNLVFIDRLKLPDGKIKLLKSKFVDTGMGLERILSILEKVESNYDTDLFIPLFDVIHNKSNVDNYKGTLDSELDINYRVLVDHMRMITISLSDGIKPGRRNASFMVRSMIKKCIDICKNDFHQEVPKYLLFDLADETIRILSYAYPELKENVRQIRRILHHETKRYLDQLSRVSSPQGASTQDSA